MNIVKLIVKFLIISMIIITQTSCERYTYSVRVEKKDKTATDSLLTGQCVKGMFIGYYCDGIAIKVLDQSDIGKNWIGFNSVIYENTIVASIDTIYSKAFPDIKNYFNSGSIFYFRYNKGGYPRLQYNLCEPAPFITINLISESNCN